MRSLPETLFDQNWLHFSGQQDWLARMDVGCLAHHQPQKRASPAPSWQRTSTYPKRLHGSCFTAFVTRGSGATCDAHYEVGRKVRETMRELSGIMPEDLPVAADVKKIATLERKQQRMRAVPAQLRIDQPLAAPKASDPFGIDLTNDLWKYALLIMSIRPNGEISTIDLIEEMSNYVKRSEHQMAANESRKDSKLSQIVRNLKSHQTSKNNFIYRGFAEDVEGGFKVTTRGFEFVLTYFTD
jgi:hypothetical protein